MTRLNANLLAAHVGINAPHYKSSRFYNFPLATERKKGAAGPFEALFKTPVSHADHHPRDLSALSPAAYFVDLVRLLEKHGVRDSLEKRRGDLWKMDLDREHVEELVPFLQIVNEVMAAQLGGPSKAVSRLAEEHHPFDLPVNLPLVQIRAYLAHFGIALTDVYEAFGLPEDDKSWGETLGMSADEFALVATPHADAASLNKAYGVEGITDDEQLGGLAQIQTFLTQTGLTPDQLTELLQLELADARTIKLQTPESGEVVTPPSFAKLDLATLDRWNRFIRLSKRLNWSFSDLHLALRSVGVKLSSSTAESLARVAHVKRICDKRDVSVEVLCSLFTDLNTDPPAVLPGATAARSLFDRVFNTPPFYTSDTNEAAPDYDPATNLLHWDSTAGDAENQGIRASLQAALSVGNDDLQAIVDVILDVSDDEDPTPISLDVKTLSTLYRYSTMASLFGLKVKDVLLLLDWLDCLPGDVTEDEETPGLLQVQQLDQLRMIDDWAEWLNSAGLSADQLHYLTHNVERRIIGFGPTKQQLAPLLSELHAALMPTGDEPQTVNPDLGNLARSTIQQLAELFDQDPLLVETAMDYLGISDEGLKKLLTTDAPPPDPLDLGGVGLEDLTCLLCWAHTLAISAAGFAALLNNLALLRRTEDHGVRLEDPSDEDKWTEEFLVNHGLVQSTTELRVEQSHFNTWMITATDWWPRGKLPTERAGSVLGSVLLTPDGKNLFLASYKGGVLRSEDGGLTWNPVNVGLGAAVVCGLALSPDGPSLDARTVDGGVFRARCEDQARNEDHGWHNPVWKKVPQKEQELREPIETGEASGGAKVRQQVLDRWLDSWPVASSNVRSLTVAPDGKSFFAVHHVEEKDGGASVDELWQYQATMETYELVLETNGDVSVSCPRRSEIAGNLDRDTLRASHEFAELVKTCERQVSADEKTAKTAADLVREWALRDPADPSILCGLETITGGKASQAKHLREILRQRYAAETPEPEQHRVGRYRALSDITTMKRCFELAAKLGVDVQMLIQLCQASSLDDYKNAARGLLALLKSKYTADEWVKTFGPIRDHLNERERDALAALLLHDLHFETLQDLSEFLLIDVEMSGCAETSHVKAAIGSLQTFVERCQMHLEDEVELSPEIPDSLWAWMGHYRMWEANRKVFLYPENYLEPSQRKQATPLFKELQSELLQGEITGEAVTEAYINYFDKLDELASMNIVDAHIGTVTNPLTAKEEETLFLIARTSSDPPVYYQRRAVLDPDRHRFTAWCPWEKIELTIPAGSVTACYMLNRLYLYWVEQTTRKDRKDLGSDKVPTTTATVRYSYQKVSGRWLQPQTHRTDKDMTVVGGSPFVHEPLTIPVGRPSNSRPTPKLIVQYVPGDPPEAEGRFSVRLPSSYWAKNHAVGTALERATPIGIHLLVNAGWSRLELGAHALAVTPGGQTLFAAGSNTLNQLALEGWSTAWASPTDIGTTRASVVATPDGQTVIVAGWGKGVTEYQVGDRSVTSITGWPDESARYVLDLALTPRGDTLFAALTGGEVFGRAFPGDRNTKWDRISKKPLPLPDNKEVRVRLALTPDGRTLFASTERGGVWRTEIIEGGQSDKWIHVEDVPAETRSVSALVVTPDGGTIFAATSTGLFRRQLNDSSDDGWLKVHARGLKTRRGPIDDGPERTQTFEEFGQTPHATSLALTPDARTLFVGTHMGGIVRFNLQDGSSTEWLQDSDWYDLVRDLYDDRDCRTTALVATPDGRTLFACGESGVVSIPIRPSVVSDGGDSFFVISPVVQEDEEGVWNRATYQRLTTRAVHPLRTRLATGGLDALLALESQSTAEDQGSSHLQLGEQYLFLPKDAAAFDRMDFDLDNPYAIYFREIFFHIPFLIADALNHNQQFEDARKWYQYLLDPTRREDGAKGSDDDKDGAPGNNGMWRYLPFRGHTVDKLLAAVTDPAHENELVKDAFDPDAIAQTRLGAYEKCVAMKYLDNLLDWGDMLFAQDNWESINQAVVLYVRALNLLGPKPKPEWVSIPATNNVDEVKKEVHKPGQSVPNLLKLEAQAAESADAGQPWYDDPFFDVPLAFCLPENDQFAGYWDKAQDRLNKIRHCMNIEGVVRQLPLFQAPIDPAQLVRAMASGRGIGGGTKLTPTVPHYRFAVMLHQAKSLTATVIQLGSALLSALEKRDAEQLQLMRSAHERTILKLTRQIKDSQVQDAQYAVDGLQGSLKGACYRQGHYRKLIAAGLSEREQTSQQLIAGGLIAQYLAHAVRADAVAAHLIPTIYGLSDGGFQPGSAVSEAATLSDALAGIAGQKAAQAATTGQHQRRTEDWQMQKCLADFDVQQLESHLEAARIHLEIAQHEVELHDKTIDQSAETEEFLRRRFTNKELQQWMIGRVSAVYFQTYKLAVDLARSAERAYQYERHTDRVFVDSGQWDSLKKGLLAGEGLMLSLNQLDKAHLDGDARELEIEKTISLLQLAPEQLLNLKNHGTCTFELTEQLFDYDFPGHYCRQIKSVSISIPAVVGPYQNIQATLTQQSDRLLLEAHEGTVDFLLKGTGQEKVKEGVLRSGWRRQQQIAISRGVDDSGMFQLDFRDERYLPFEGTGAISRWELRLDKGSNRNLDFGSISDVVVKLRYTALDGGAAYRRHVVCRPEIAWHSGHRLVSLRQEFPNDWHQFVENKKPLVFTMPADRFAINCDKGSLKVAKKNPGEDPAGDGPTLDIGLRAVWGEEHSGAHDLRLKLTQPGEETGKQVDFDKDVGSVKSTNSELIVKKNDVLEPWTITWSAEVSSTLDGLHDLLLLVPFTGKLPWSQQEN